MFGARTGRLKAKSQKDVAGRIYRMLSANGLVHVKPASSSWRITIVDSGNWVSIAVTIWNVSKRHPVALAVTATMLIYFLMAYASILSYSPDANKPSGGIRVRLKLRDMTPIAEIQFAATIR